MGRHGEEGDRRALLSVYLERGPWIPIRRYELPKGGISNAKKGSPHCALLHSIGSVRIYVMSLVDGLNTRGDQSLGLNIDSPNYLTDSAQGRFPVKGGVHSLLRCFLVAGHASQKS